MCAKIVKVILEVNTLKGELIKVTSREGHNGSYFVEFPRYKVLCEKARELEARHMKLDSAWKFDKEGYAYFYKFLLEKGYLSKYVYVSGEETYFVKDELKALGGRWNSIEKTWAIPVENSEKAKQLVKEVIKEKKNEKKKESVPVGLDLTTEQNEAINQAFFGVVKIWSERLNDILADMREYKIFSGIAKLKELVSIVDNFSKKTEPVKEAVKISKQNASLN